MSMARAIWGTLAVISAYTLLVYLDNGYLTDEATIMLGMLIIAGFAFVLGVGFLLRRHKPPRG